MRYPYLQVARGTYAPIIHLDIWTGSRWMECDAYVDSGATYSIFHTDIASILGLSYQKGRKILILVGDGKRILVYLRQLPVKFDGYKFKATIGFSQGLGVGFNLLGRASFFNRIRICFNDKEKALDTTYLGT